MILSLFCCCCLFLSVEDRSWKAPSLAKIEGGHSIFARDEAFQLPIFKKRSFLTFCVFRFMILELEGMIMSCSHLKKNIYTLYDLFQEIRAALPGSFRVSVIHQTLWTTGSFIVRTWSFLCVCIRTVGWARRQRVSTPFLTQKFSWAQDKLVRNMFAETWKDPACTCRTG